jgi:NADH-quinone oxidoreductase subunit L
VFELSFLIPAIPFASALLLAIGGPRMGRKAIAAIGVGSIGLITVIASLITWRFLSAPPAGNSYLQVLWTWMNAGGFSARIGFYLDAVSVLMTLVVTFVSFLIHLYSAEFMAEDEGYSRFFCYMNLFVASMVTLLLANNLLLLYLGWEGVGLCSYLLIGFWYTDPANGRAARKAFIVTRVGDSSLILGLFLLWHTFGTLDIQSLMQHAARQWAGGSVYATAAALLLLGGAVGKSAQLPLQTWLPDAMAGPTPTSALIHAATMVTAGVYLIARTHVLYTLSATGQTAVAVVGAATLLFAGFCALTQSDIKRVLAYSTVSQIGYMFFACGVGAWAAAIFHFMTHAFFKALLFLAAGSVINALHHEHNIFKMGGLRKELPVTFWTFLIAGCSLAGLPLVTAGFYSKGLIIWSGWASEKGSPGLWAVAVIGVFLTSLYIFRLIFLVFFGEVKEPVHHKPGWTMKGPLVVLGALSAVGGFVNLPPWLGNKPALVDFLQLALPPVREAYHGAFGEVGSELVATAAFFAGLYVAWLFFIKHRGWADALYARPALRALHRLWASDWGMDWLYDHVFVLPVAWIARADKSDWVDLIYAGIAGLCRGGYSAIRVSENGKVRWYAAAVALGAVILVGVVLFR